MKQVQNVSPPLPENGRRWLHSAPFLRKIAPTFYAIGIAFALVQLIGFRAFGSNLGSELVLELIPVKALMYSALGFAILALLAVIATARQRRPWWPPGTVRVANWFADACCIATSSLAGVGTVAALSGSTLYGFGFLTVSLYFLSMSEFVLTHVHDYRPAKLYWLSWAFLVGVPFS